MLSCSSWQRTRMVSKSIGCPAGGLCQPKEYHGPSNPCSLTIHRATTRGGKWRTQHFLLNFDGTAECHPAPGRRRPDSLNLKFLNCNQSLLLPARAGAAHLFSHVTTRHSWESKKLHRTHIQNPFPNSKLDIVPSCGGK
jgi:hypothetical protein